MASNPLLRPAEGPGRFNGVPAPQLPRVSGNALRMPPQPAPGNPLINPVPQAPPGPGPIQPGLQDGGFSPAGMEDRVSTRLPEAAGLTYDPHERQNLSIGRHAMIEEGFGPGHVPPEQHEKALAAIRAGTGKIAEAIRNRYPMIDTDGLSDQGTLERFIEHASENTRHWWDRVSDRPWQPIAMGWYRGANRLAHQFSAEHTDVSPRQAAGVIASLSPSMDWNKNVELARRILRMRENGNEKVTPEMLDRMGEYVAARKVASQREALASYVRDIRPGMKLSDLSDPIHQALFMRSFDEKHGPGPSYDIISPNGERFPARTKSGELAKLAWQSIPNVANAMQILGKDDRANISRSLGSAHKVRSFYNNIVAPDAGNFLPFDHRDVTSDTHQINANLFHPLGSGHPLVAQGLATAPAIGLTGSKGLYGLHADAVRRMAHQVSRDERRLVLPNQAQSVTWEAVRNTFAKQHKAMDEQGLPLHEVGRTARGSHFARRFLFMPADYARDRIIAAAGGIKDPDWWTGVANDEE